MLIIHKEIIKNYENLYKTKEGYDVIIYAGEEPNIKEFHAHSLILKAQSKFFKRAFTENIQKKEGYFIINLRNSPDVLEILLSYMYCSNDLMKLQSRKILNLLLPSDELEFQFLVKYIQEILVRDHRNFIIENILEIIELTYQKESFDKLWINKFRDDFYVYNEIIIWDNLLKWACGQDPIIQQDINKWNKNEFTMMEKRLSRFIQLIRFYHISSEDFHLKLDRYVWDKFACGSRLMIEDNGKVIYAQPGHKHQNVRAKMTLEGKGVFEWDVIIEKKCDYAWVGVCASENFSFTLFAGYQPTGWVLGSSGDCYNSDSRIFGYCPSFTNGAIITVHLDMDKRTCAFTINGIKYPEVSKRKNLPSKLYPIVSLKYPGLFRIQPH
ncbi:concanavalin A-like lectin/glucanase domain-containing protein [Glomus cerebriforme]|uniref:Concanavalin A-like lectin/glucanase domain-containing protein n=1 Tax=Glomus cerebriforme TaxID=658196 RepID=A0A397S7C6_9GLOM|nr:concanavalin A-like lectin/glucanase domain-containing protein [Glomus cerebriforme]